MDADKISELLELTKENNRILRSMHRRMLWSQILTYFYWLIILGVAGWSYYIVQPYMGKYWSMFQALSAQISGLESGSMSLPGELGGLLEKLK